MSLKPKQSTGVSDKNGEVIYEGDVIKYIEFPDTLYRLEYTSTVVWSEENQKFGVWEDSIGADRYSRIFKDIADLRLVEVNLNSRDNSISESSSKSRPR